MISHRHRCLYLQMPKCASSAILAWFLAHGGGRYTFRPSWYPGPLEHRIVRVANALELYPGYFTFTFVRDPVRRFVSLYSHATRLADSGARRQPRTYGTVHQFAQLCAELLADTRGLWGKAALAFRAEHGGRRYGPLGIPLRELNFLACHARAQVDFLPGGGRARLFGVALPHEARLSFIGSVETLDADFARLRERLGLPAQALPRRNVSAPAPEAWAALRGNADTRRMVEAIYAEDFGLADVAQEGRKEGAWHGDRRRALAAGLAAPARVCRPARACRPVRAVRRAALALATMEVALEARIVRTAPLRRLLAPLSRWRRRLAR